MVEVASVSTNYNRINLGRPNPSLGGINLETGVFLSKVQPTISVQKNGFTASTGSSQNVIRQNEINPLVPFIYFRVIAGRPAPRDDEPDAWTGDKRERGEDTWRKKSSLF